MGDKIEIKGNIYSQYLNALKRNLIDMAANGNLKTLSTEQPKDTKMETQSTKEPSKKNESDIVFFKYSFIQKQG